MVLAVGAGVFFSRREGSQETEVEIEPGQLCVGLFVRLPQGWLAHPFLFNQFRISKAEQIATIKSLGMSRIVVVPERSTAAPLALVPDEPTEVPGPSPEALRGVEEKRRCAERVAARRERLARCEKSYERAATRIRDLMRNLYAASEQSVVSARELISGVVEDFADNSDVVIHLMGENVADENAYFHALNVMILSLLLGRAVGLPAEALRIVGEGALFHDLGKTRVPDPVLRNPRRGRHEEEFYRLHPLYGAEIAGGLGVFHAEAVRIMAEHHEREDGRGFPKGLPGAQLSPLGKIVAIVNRFDNLCNPLRSEEALTPAEALSAMFKRECERWDEKLLQMLVRILGVYPPGSIVQLSNGNVGIVVAVDQSDLLLPSVMIYDPSVPKAEAIIVDLTNAMDVRVDAVLRPADLSPEALRYLAPRRCISYYHSRRAQ